MSSSRRILVPRGRLSQARPPPEDLKDGLCNDCSQLNLELSFKRAFDLYEGARRGRNSRTLDVYRSNTGPPYLGYFHYVTSLGDRLLRVTQCTLCGFLKQMTTKPSQGTYKLLAICTSESYLFETPKHDQRHRKEKRPWGGIEHNVFMAVVPEVPGIPKIGVPLRWLESELPKNGSIYRLAQMNASDFRLARPRAIGSQADFGLMNDWLGDCREAHDCCAPKKPVGALLRGFRAINCMSNPPRVEERSWSQPYVALSYVWGPPAGDWPKTILDAVAVTRQLGEKYLWVDRLCINQSDLEEKQFLISKMDAIYEGAEFTIVAAAGDARTGLPGVMNTPRRPQPQVDMKTPTLPTSEAQARQHLASAADPYMDLFGVTHAEYAEIRNDGGWLDLHRMGLTNKVVLDPAEFLRDQAIEDKYGISHKHLKIFQDFAGDYQTPIEKWMEQMVAMAQKMGIPLTELAPRMLKDIATSMGMPQHMIDSIKRRPSPPMTLSSRPELPLPEQLVVGRTTLVSTLEDPRVTIRNSEWATRGWTYQEGILSNRRLVFTEQQVYWECSGMAMNESLDLLDLYDPCGTHLADYMLSGIFDGDLHRVPELQYGYRPSSTTEVSEQLVKLDSHIRAFTSRKLSYESDSLNAFLGVATRYSNDNGLFLLLGMPVLAGLFANGKPGLQDTFALSVSAWTHTAQPEAKGSELYVADCSRRKQFPSWTWAGWTGRADFSTTTAIGEEQDQPSGFEDAMHVEFFKAMTSTSWVNGIAYRLWSAEMLLNASDGSEGLLLAGQSLLAGIATDQAKTWLLTVRDPLVLRHMWIMHSTIEEEWRRLMGKTVQIHLSVPITEEQLKIGHKNGELMTLLVFASIVPFVFNGMARYLILRRADNAGTRWERVGRLEMEIEEHELNKYKSTAEMINALPVRKLGRDIVII
ncbi:hypothetical protein MMC25_002975 [Agyrium rufum]|nr:hypothetical protein [Agyrium rufum]